MDDIAWLKQCESWTSEDTELYRIGDKSGIAVDPDTGKPLTTEDIIRIHESLDY